MEPATASRAAMKSTAAADRASVESAIAAKSLAASESLRPTSCGIPVEALEAFTAVERCRAVEVSALEAVEPRSRSDRRAAMKSLPPAAANREAAPVAAVAEVPPSAAVMEVHPRRIVEIHKSAAKRRPVKPVKPRSRSNKHAAHEPFRPVIAIRRARVRRIGIVSVGAYRCRPNIRRPHVPRSHSNPYGNAHSSARRSRRHSGECHHKSHDSCVL